ncbi:hypothetical protein LG299_02715 [Microbacterium lacus]|uniref:hypothetical protein n=1 Tax=Microbacterium lacus TaxID=415217 RepID=UPI00384EE2D2
MRNDPTLTRESRQWINQRNWGGSPELPHLGGLAVVAVPNGYGVASLESVRAGTPILAGTWPAPEYAKRYVEHVHNFGRPPY